MRVSQPNYKKIAQQYAVSEQEVKNIYKSVFAFIREKVTVLPFQNMTNNNFEQFKVNFNIPEIGKLGTDIKRIEAINNNERHYNQEHQTDVHTHIDN